MAVKLKCSACGDKFPWDTALPFPKACPLCGDSMPTDKGGEDEIVMPFISYKKFKSPDMVFRAMEKGAEHRINVASEITGLPKSEFASLKETNMKDNMREGETSYIPVNNDVSRHMDQMKARGLPVGFGVANGSEYAPSVQSGPYPNAGAKTQNAIRSMHSRYASGGMSERPGLETLQPGYKARS